MKEQKTKQPTKAGKVINIVIDVVLVVVIIFGAICAFTAFQTKAGGGVPSIFGVRFFPIESDSMDPTIKKGDLAIDVAVRDYTKLKKGDIITYWTVIQGQQALVTHTIVDITHTDMENGKKEDKYIVSQDVATEDSRFVTEGDNPQAKGQLTTVAPNKIVGKYSFKLSGVGTFIDFLQTSKGFALVIVLPVALFFIWQLIMFFRSLFAYKEEKARLKFQEQFLEAEKSKNEQTDADKTDNAGEIQE